MTHGSLSRGGRLAAALAFFLASSLALADEAMLYRDEDLSKNGWELVYRSQAESMRLAFDEAKRLAAECEAADPRHTLPLVMDVGVRLYEIQELLETREVPDKIYDEFLERDDRLIAMCERRIKADPKAPEPLLHIGAAYGCRGLVKLYQGRYLQSYRDGKKGVGYLKQAVALDPNRADAFMGLGQFEYYCDTLNGVLQFLLDLEGNAKEGIAKLRIAESKGTYGAWAARVFLVKILIYDQKDWDGVAPLLKRTCETYPENYHHIRCAMAYARGKGYEDPLARQLLEDASRRWDAGWRPPAYVKDFPLDKARVQLAHSYLAQGRKSDAQRHLKAAGLAGEAEQNEGEKKLMTTSGLKK